MGVRMLKIPRYNNGNFHFVSDRLVGPLGRLTERQLHKFFLLLDSDYPRNEHLYFQCSFDGGRTRIMLDDWQDRYQNFAYRFVPECCLRGGDLLYWKRKWFQDAQKRYEELQDYEKDEVVTIDYLIKNFGTDKPRHRTNGFTEDGELRFYRNCKRILDYALTAPIKLPECLEATIKD